jgi:hypothetical protein
MAAKLDGIGGGGGSEIFRPRRADLCQRAGWEAQPHFANGKETLASNCENFFQK